jgi:hypothetical protein
LIQELTELEGPSESCAARIDHHFEEPADSTSRNRKLLDQLTHPPLLPAAKPMFRLGVAFGHKRLGVSRIILTQKKFTVSMNSISLSKALICPGQAHCAGIDLTHVLLADFSPLN